MVRTTSFRLDYRGDSLTVPSLRETIRHPLQRQWMLFSSLHRGWRAVPKSAHRRLKDGARPLVRRSMAAQRLLDGRSTDGDMTEIRQRYDRDKAEKGHKKEGYVWVVLAFVATLGPLSTSYSASGAATLSQQVESHASHASFTSSTTSSAHSSSVASACWALLPQEAKDTATTVANTNANFFI